MHRHAMGFVLVVVLLAMIAGPALAQEGSSDDMMAKWMEMMAPGDAHKVLDYFVGDWAVTATMWMQGPDGPAMSYPKGTASFEWTLDGRFLKGTVLAPMDEGMNYEDLTFIGYDNFRQQYIAMGMSNVATNFNTAAGNYIEEENIFLMYQQMDEPLTGEVAKVSTHIYRMHSDDKFTIEVTDPVYGAENNVVGRFEYVRK